jgi:hypothetical protein
MKKTDISAQLQFLEPISLEYQHQPEFLSGSRAKEHTYRAPKLPHSFTSSSKPRKQILKDCFSQGVTRGVRDHGPLFLLRKDWPEFLGLKNKLERELWPQFLNVPLCE